MVVPAVRFCSGFKALGALAVAGVVFTHWLAYVVAGEPVETGTSATIHRYWAMASALGLGSLVVAVGGLLLRYHRGPGLEGRAPVSTVARRAALQAAG